MPIKKYRVDTDKGAFIVEVEEPDTSPNPMMQPHVDSDTPEHEPDTYRGGFMKGLKDYFTEGLNNTRPLLERAARPQGDTPLETVGNLLTLIIPSEIPNLVAPFKNLKAQVNLVRQDAAELARMSSAGEQSTAIGRALGAPTNFGRALKSRLTDPLPIRDRMLQSQPWRQVEMPLEDFPAGQPAPSARAVPPQPGVQRNLNDLPLYKQQELMDQAGEVPAAGDATRTQMPRPANLGHETTPAPSNGRLVKTPPPAEDPLASVLEEMLTGEDLAKAQRTTSAPPIETAGEGPLRQSGKFDRSGSLGQPGGYSSGRPSITPDDYDGLASKYADKFVETGETPRAPSAVEEASSDSAASQTPDSRELAGGEEAGRSEAGTSAAGPSLEQALDDPSFVNGTGEWHSGEPSGSPEAAQAEALHRYEAELANMHKSRLEGDPDLLRLIMRGLKDK